MKFFSLAWFICLSILISSCSVSRCDSDGDCPSTYFCGQDSYCYSFGVRPEIAGGLCGSSLDCADGSVCWLDGCCWPHNHPTPGYESPARCLSGTRYDAQTDTCYTPDCDSIWDCPVAGTGEYANCSPAGFCEPLIRCEVTDDCHILLGEAYRCYFGICRYNL